MNKEELILELNNFVNSIPKDVADKDFYQRYTQSIEIRKLIEDTEKELIKVENKLDGLDQTAAFDVISKEVEIREAENDLEIEEINFSTFQNSLNNIEGEINGNQKYLDSLKKMNESSYKVTKELEKLKNSSDRTISNSTLKRLENIEQERKEREKKIVTLESEIKEKRIKFEEKSKNKTKFEENIKNRKEYVQRLKDQLDTFRSENVDKLTTEDTLRKIDLQNRLTALNQANTVLTINPIIEIKNIINDLEKDLIDQEEVLRRLEPLKAALSITNPDAESREKEISDISKRKLELEEKIKEKETELADSNNFNRTNKEEIAKDLYEKEEQERERLNSHLRNFDIADYNDAQQRRGNLYEIKRNERYINEFKNAVADAEKKIKNQEFINEGLNIPEEEASESLKPLHTNHYALKKHLEFYEQRNETLRLNNEQMDLDKIERNFRRESYQKKIYELNLKSDIDRRLRKTKEDELYSYKNELNALNLREQYLQLSVADKFNSLLDKLPKNNVYEEPKLNRTQQEIYDKILAGLPLEDREKAIEKAKELDNPNDTPEIKEKKEKENKPTPIASFKALPRKILDALKANSRKIKIAIAILLASTTLVGAIAAGVFLYLDKKNSANPVIPPAITQPIGDIDKTEELPIVTPTPQETTEPTKPDTPTNPTKPDTPDDPNTPDDPEDGYELDTDETIENPGQNNFPETNYVDVELSLISGLSPEVNKICIDGHGKAWVYFENRDHITVDDVAKTETNPNDSSRFKISDIDYDKIKAKIDETLAYITPLPPTGDEITEEEAEEAVDDGTLSPEEKGNADAALEEYLEGVQAMLNNDGTQINPEGSEIIDGYVEGQGMGR